MKWSMIVLLASACGSPQPAVSAVPVTVAAPEEPPAPVLAESAEGITQDVLDFVSGHPSVASWTLAPLREYRREDRTMLIAWPMLDPNGEIVDDDIIVFVVDRSEDGSLAFVGENANVMRMRSSDLEDRMGGPGAEAFPRPGVPADQVGPIMEESTQAFAAAVALGDAEGAAAAVLRIAALYPADKASQLENASEILIGAFTGRFVLSHVETTRVSDEQFDVHVSLTAQDGSASPVVLHLRPNERGQWVLYGRT